MTDDEKRPPADEAPAEEAPPLSAVESEGDGDGGAGEEEEARALSRLESLVFAFPEPITVRRLARLLSLEGRRVRKLIERLQERYEDRGIVLREVSGGFRFETHPDNAAVVRAALKLKPMRLSRAALETLSIVAYRQPVTRADVEDVRRVDCGGTLKYLSEKGLVRVLGRKEEPGRPILYGTSGQFLELFGLKSLSDLPSLREFTELWEEHQQLVEETAPEPGAEEADYEDETGDIESEDEA